MNIDRLAFNSTSKITLTLNVKQINSHENERLQEEVAPSAVQQIVYKNSNKIFGKEVSKKISWETTGNHGQPKAINEKVF